MQIPQWLSSLQESLGAYLPRLLGGLAILIVGWIVALILAAVTRRALTALRLNTRLNRHTAEPFNFERLAGRIVFWSVLLLAAIGMFGVLNIDGVTGPLSTLADTVMMYLPRLLVAAFLAGLAWLLATVMRGLVHRGLDATRMDEKLSEAAEMQPLSTTMGNVVYWLVWLLFLPAIVSALQIEGLMVPLSSMTTSMLGMLPNLLGAAIIALVGWIIAKAVRGLVSNLLAATGIDKAGDKTETLQDLRLSQLGGTLAFILVIVPTLIAALDALRIDAISRPLTRMLDVMLGAVPNVLAAAAILLLAWFVGRFVAGLVARLLTNLGFDLLPQRLGLAQAITAPEPLNEEEKVKQTKVSLSVVASHVALFFIMLFATVEAAGMLGFEGIHELLEAFIAFGADVLLGLVIFVVGYWFADLAATGITRANADARSLALIAKVAILGLVIAMGLRAMGIADEIVSLAFGLVLGAVSIAVALAFGLGGREAAGRVANRWAGQYLEKLKEKDERAE